MSRVALASIPALTFYKDSETQARRSRPIPQLKCIGKPCRLYSPEVVRCVNLGGSGTEVDWKCEADLPEALRFGKVEVSCEGWGGPGDPYVLKGSCGLEYRLVEVPGSLRNYDPHHPSRIPQWFSRENVALTMFWILWTGCLLLLLYFVVKSWLNSTGSRGSGSMQPRPRPPGSGGYTPGGFWSNDHGNTPGDPPPPYSEPKPQPESSSSWSSWRPGFWTGAALGGLAGAFNRSRNDSGSQTSYDWERERSYSGLRPSSGSIFSGGRRPAPSSDDRGEGSSTARTSLGSVRRSTGFGGSSVR